MYIDITSLIQGGSFYKRIFNLLVKQARSNATVTVYTADALLHRHYTIKCQFCQCERGHFFVLSNNVKTHKNSGTYEEIELFSKKGLIFIRRLLYNTTINAWG